MAPGGTYEVIEVDEGAGPIRIFAKTLASLGDLIEQGRQHGEATCIVDGDHRLTFDDYFAKVDGLAAHLANRPDCKPGDVIALNMRNSAAWMIGFSAIVLSGHIPALINSRSSSAAMHAAIEDGAAVLMVVDEKRLDALRGEGNVLPAICWDAGGKRSDADDFYELASGATDAYSRPEVEATDTAALFYTSGTTGRAKAAAISHRAIITGSMNTQMAREAIFQRMADAYNTDVETITANLPQSSSLLVFPLFHVSGCSSLFLVSLASGAKLVLQRRWSAEDAFKLIDAENVTAMTSVPTMLWDILRSPVRSNYDLSSLTAFSSGGQALPAGLLDELFAAYPNAFFGTGYGMTEMSGSLCQATGEEFLKSPNSSGRVLPIVDLKTVDDDGNDLPAGAPGELWARGAGAMNGYWLKGEVNKPFKPGGWYATGDVGRVDEDGYVFILDRKTDMVISGGENIYCAEVEKVLGAVEGVDDITAFGVPDNRLGEVLYVVAVSNQPADIIRGAVEAHANSALGMYKRPRQIFVQTDALPRSATHKVEKRLVRERILAQIQDPKH